MTNHPFDLKGIDTRKIGGNKYVDYKLSDFIEDQNITPTAGVRSLETAGYNLGDLKVVPRETKAGRFFQPFLKKDFYLPTGITERLAEADKVKTEKENYDPFGDLDKLKAYNLDLIREQDKISRKGRLADVGMEYAMMRANLPYIENMQKRLSTFKQGELLAAEAIKQNLPNARQQRLLTGDTGFATQAGAIAGQQDAATRFAALGANRSFGQLS